MTKDREYAIVSKSKGTVVKTCYGFKVINKDINNKAIVGYEHIEIPINSTFTIIRFNVATKRVVIFLDIKEQSTFICELDYDMVRDNCAVDNANIFKDVECVYTVEREKLVLSKENIRDIILILLVFIIGGILF